MSTKNITFEDILDVKSIDKDAKVFDKVQRVEGITRDAHCYITMDINSEIYPMKVGTSYNILLAKTIYDSEPKNLEYELFSNTKSSLMDKYDYVMRGKVFQFNKDKKEEGENSEPDTLSINVSFGGLLLQISGLKKDEKTGKPEFFESIDLDETIYLLIKKMN